MTQRIAILSLVFSLLLALAAVTVVLRPEPASAQTDGLSLITDTPDEGYELAVSLARRGVSTTQPDREVLFSLRDDYATDAGLLIASSRVIAIHFRTIAEANDHWR